MVESRQVLYKVDGLDQDGRGVPADLGRVLKAHGPPLLLAAAPARNSGGGGCAVAEKVVLAAPGDPADVHPAEDVEEDGRAVFTVTGADALLVHRTDVGRTR